MRSWSVFKRKAIYVRLKGKLSCLFDLPLHLQALSLEVYLTPISWKLLDARLTHWSRHYCLVRIRLECVELLKFSVVAAGPLAGNSSWVDGTQGMGYGFTHVSGEIFRFRRRVILSIDVVGCIVWIEIIWITEAVHLNWRLFIRKVLVLFCHLLVWVVKDVLLIWVHILHTLLSSYFSTDFFLSELHSCLIHTPAFLTFVVRLLVFKWASAMGTQNIIAN